MKPTAALLALCATAALAVAAPAAQADSIAYIKDGDVWLSTPDGSRQYQVTATGKYSYVSQADDGTMIALAPNERLNKLSRTGEVLADFPTYVSDGAPQSGPVNQFAGPFAPEISPDGKLVAFEWFNNSYDNDAGCSTASVPPCSVLTARQGVGITRSDGFTGFEDYGLMTGWLYPQWITDTKLMRSWTNGVFNEDAVFTDVGPGKGDSSQDRWLYDSQGGTLIDVELARDQKAAVAIAGWNDEQIRAYRPIVDPFNAPDYNFTPFAKNDPIVEGCFALKDPDGGKFEGLSIAPDSRHFAFGDGAGVHVADLPDFSSGCAQPASFELRIPGGRWPHWGPADVPPARAAVPGAGGGQAAPDNPSQASPQQQGPGTTKDAAAKAKLVGSPSTRLAKLVRGVKATVAVPGAGTVTVTAARRGKTLARGTARTLAAGQVRVTVRATKAGKKALRAKGGRALRLKLAVSFAPKR